LAHEDLPEHPTHKRALSYAVICCILESSSPSAQNDVALLRLPKIVAADFLDVILFFWTENVTYWFAIRTWPNS
jgi:hypothetical protein